MPAVYLGNTAPIDTVRSGLMESDEVERRPMDVDGEVTTEFQVPDGTKLHLAVLTVTRVYDGYHSDAPPSWVSSDNQTLAYALAEHYTTDDHQVEIRPLGDAGGEE